MSILVIPLGNEGHGWWGVETHGRDDQSGYSESEVFDQ